MLSGSEERDPGIPTLGRATSATRRAITRAGALALAEPGCDPLRIAESGSASGVSCWRLFTPTTNPSPSSPCRRGEGQPCRARHTHVHKTHRVALPLPKH